MQSDVGTIDYQQFDESKQQQPADFSNSNTAGSGIGGGGGGGGGRSSGGIGSPPKGQPAGGEANQYKDAHDPNYQTLAGIDNRVCYKSL